MHELGSTTRETTHRVNWVFYSRICKAAANGGQKIGKEEDLTFVGLGELKMDKNYVEEGMKESFYYRKTRAQQEAAL